MLIQSSYCNQRAHDEVAAQTEAFLANGGYIQRIPTGVSALDNEGLSRGYRYGVNRERRQDNSDLF